MPLHASGGFGKYWPGVEDIAQKKRPGCRQPGRFKFSPGDDLLSHDLNTAVSLAMKGLTSGFGMEPGVPPSLWPPGQSPVGCFTLKVFGRGELGGHLARRCSGRPKYN